MKCEICKTIEKLGLDPATHEQWVCADAKSPRLALKKAQIAVHHCYQAMNAFLHTKLHDAGYRLYQKAHYVTLGL